MEADVTVQFTLKFRSHSSVECGEKNHIECIRKNLFSFVWNKAQFKCHGWRAKLSHWADFLCGASQSDAVYSEYAAKSLIKLHFWSNFCSSWCWSIIAWEVFLGLVNKVSCSYLFKTVLFCELCWRCLNARKCAGSYQKRKGNTKWEKWEGMLNIYHLIFHCCLHILSVFGGTTKHDLS